MQSASTLVPGILKTNSPQIVIIFDEVPQFVRFSHQEVQEGKDQRQIILSPDSAGGQIYTAVMCEFSYCNNDTYLQN